MVFVGLGIVHCLKMIYIGVFDMRKISQEKALELLQSLVGTPFTYGFKSPDMDLFDLGFGENIQFINFLGKTQETRKYHLHFTSEFHLEWKNGVNDIYDIDTETDEFQKDIQPLLGLPIKRIALSSKNDLWLDFGVCYGCVVTYEDQRESWRFLIPGTDAPHLVALGCSLVLE